MASLKSIVLFSIVFSNLIPCPKTNFLVSVGFLSSCFFFALNISFCRCTSALHSTFLPDVVCCRYYSSVNGKLQAKQYIPHYFEILDAGSKDDLELLLQDTSKIDTQEDLASFF